MYGSLCHFFNGFVGVSLRPASIVSSCCLQYDFCAKRGLALFLIIDFTLYVEIGIIYLEGGKVAP